MSMLARLILALMLCGAVAEAKPSEAKPSAEATAFQLKPSARKKLELRVDQVLHSLVQMPSAAPPVERGRLVFASTGVDPNVFIGAAAFSVLTAMAANLESPTMRRALCGPAHVGPAILDGGFGVAFAGNY